MINFTYTNKNPLDIDMPKGRISSFDTFLFPRGRPEKFTEVNNKNPHSVFREATRYIINSNFMPVRVFSNPTGQYEVKYFDTIPEQIWALKVPTDSILIGQQFNKIISGRMSSKRGSFAEDQGY